MVVSGKRCVLRDGRVFSPLVAGQPSSSLQRDVPSSRRRGGHWRVQPFLRHAELTRNITTPVTLIVGRDNRIFSFSLYSPAKNRGEGGACLSIIDPIDRESFSRFVFPPLDHKSREFVPSLRRIIPGNKFSYSPCPRSPPFPHPKRNLGRERSLNAVRIERGWRMNARPRVSGQPRPFFFVSSPFLERTPFRFPSPKKKKEKIRRNHVYDPPLRL